TVESSVADGQSALLLVRVDALTEEAKTFLFSDDFNSMDTWSVHPVDVPERLGETSGVTGMSYKELGELRTDTSATWRFDVDLNGAAALRVRLGHMEEGAALEFNLTPAESVTVDIGATGPGAPTLYNAQGGDLTIASVTLSPLTCQVEAAMADPDREADPLFFFLMEDGTLLTSGQSLTSVSSHCIQDKAWSFHYRFQSVMDLSQLAAVVFDGMAYPVKGGEPYPVEVDPRLYPLRLPLMAPLIEGGGYSLPVKALCEGLGASYDWNEETQTASCTYRDTTIVLTVGSPSALVNGEPVDLGEPAALQDGVLAASWRLAPLWGLDTAASFDEDKTDRICWVVIP
ncbi:copper amine oxidase N-terminal domain-containing protein, partial [Intestinimonas sp.]|uniref:copper amine oxidase N-terminal domain-containing protein n=2 Tax=Intestinimonas TaxID=1392389 RepID=UPI00263295B1